MGRVTGSEAAAPLSQDPGGKVKEQEEGKKVGEREGKERAKVRSEGREAAS